MADGGVGASQGGLSAAGGRPVEIGLPSWGVRRISGLANGWLAAATGRKCRMVTDFDDDPKLTVTRPENDSVTESADYHSNNRTAAIPTNGIPQTSLNGSNRLRNPNSLNQTPAVASR